MTKIKAKNQANAISFLNSTILTLLLLTEIRMILAVNRLFVFLLQYSSWTQRGIAYQQYDCSIDWYYKFCVDDVLIACVNRMLICQLYLLLLVSKGLSSLTVAYLSLIFFFYFIIFLIMEAKSELDI